MTNKPWEPEDPDELSPAYSQRLSAGETSGDKSLEQTLEAVRSVINKDQRSDEKKPDPK